MPLYHYRCAGCEKNFEIRHSYASVGVQCKFCNSSEIEKILSSPIRRVMAIKENNKKTGTEVIKTIEETRLEIEKTKKQKSQRIYKRTKND